MAMDIDGNVSDTTHLQSGFEWPVDGIKYLGIHIPPSLEKLYDLNYTSLKGLVRQWENIMRSLGEFASSLQTNSGDVVTLRSDNKALIIQL